MTILSLSNPTDSISGVLRGILILAVAVFLINSAGLNAAEIQTTKKSTEISKEDEQLVDEFLDKVLKIDPASLQGNSAGAAETQISVHGFNLYFSYGHDTNVLDSGWVQVGSDFYRTAADFYYKLGQEKDHKIDAYVYIENIRYPDLDAHNDQQEFIGRISGSRGLTGSVFYGANLMVASGITYDADNAYENETLPKYKYSNITLTPSLEIYTGKDVSLVSEVELFRERTSNPDDDYNRQTGRLTLTDAYRRGSENRIYCEFDTSEYQDAEVLDLDGYIIEDTLLVIDAWSVGVSNQHLWAGEHGLSLNSSLSYYRQEDNGPGYEDYSRYYIGESLQFGILGWFFSTSLGYSVYDYPKRRIYLENNSSQEYFLTVLTTGLEIRRDFRNDFSLKTGFNGLSSDSNSVYDKYEKSSFSIVLSCFF